MSSQELPSLSGATDLSWSRERFQGLVASTMPDNFPGNRSELAGSLSDALIREIDGPIVDSAVLVSGSRTYPQLLRVSVQGDGRLHSYVVKFGWNEEREQVRAHADTATGLQGLADHLGKYLPVHRTLSLGDIPCTVSISPDYGDDLEARIGRGEGHALADIIIRDLQQLFGVVYHYDSPLRSDHTCLQRHADSIREMMGIGTRFLDRFEHLDPVQYRYLDRGLVTMVRRLLLSFDPQNMAKPSVGVYVLDMVPRNLAINQNGNDPHLVLFDLHGQSNFLGSSYMALHFLKASLILQSLQYKRDISAQNVYEGLEQQDLTRQGMNEVVDCIDTLLGDAMVKLHLSSWDAIDQSRVSVALACIYEAWVRKGDALKTDFPSQLLQNTNIFLEVARFILSPDVFKLRSSILSTYFAHPDLTSGSLRERWRAAFRIIFGSRS